MLVASFAALRSLFLNSVFVVGTEGASGYKEEYEYGSSMPAVSDCLFFVSARN